MPLSEESRGEKARLALPILVKVARNPDTALYGKYPGRITYGQLGKLINVFPANMGGVCGYIRDKITRPRDLPYINCLVVSTKTGYPTEIETDDTRDDAKRKFKEFSSRVYEYEKWEERLDRDRLLDRLVDDQANLLSIEELELEIGKYPDDIELKGHLAAALVDRYYLYGEENQEAQSKADMERLGEIVRDLPQDKALYPRATLAQHDNKREESVEWLVKYVTAYSQENGPFNSDDLYFWIVLPFALSKESSLRLADALCENWPESAAVFTLQGLAKTFDEKEKVREDAIEDFVLALSKDEGYWLAAWLCAQVYDGQKNWHAARNYFYKALKSQTAQLLSGIHYELAWSLGKLKAYPDEEKHYRLCLELEPDFPGARNNLGWSLDKQGRYQEALEVFEEVIERDNDKKYPDDIELKSHLAAALVDRYHLYGEENQEAQSEADMERLGEIVRDLPQDKALYPRAILAQHDNKREESVEWLVKYVTVFSQENEPFNSDDLYFWIVLPFALSKESSLRLADALCENWPASAAVFTLQGLAKTFDEKEKVREDAIDDFVLALSKDEGYWLAAWLCAQVYDGQKNWHAARNYFYKALKSQTAQLLSDIHCELAWSLGKLKAYPDEEKHYRLCLELEPDFPGARNNLGWSLSKQGRYQEALEVFEEAIERGNDKKYPLWNKARTLKKLGHFQQAIEIWKQDVYRGKLTKFAQKEIARLEALLATEKAELPIEEPDGEGDDEGKPAELKTKLIPSRMASSERWLECMIQEQIQKDNAAFERRLKMYDHPDGYGRQYAIPAVGKIDLLVEDIETGDLVVIELKKGPFGTQAMEQISRYITWVRGNLCQKGQKVSGIICVYRASPQLRRDAKKVTELEVFEYGLTYERIV